MNSPPRIVCIETSSRVGSVAVALGGECLGTETFRTDFNHAIELLPTLQRLCSHQGWLPDSVDQVYLSIGPGSFTGLRIAVTVARTLAWSAGVRIVALPTLTVIAHNALDLVDAPQSVAVLLDAKRGQVYCGSFELRDDRYRQNLEADVRNPAAFCAGLAAPRVLMGEGITYHEPALAKIEHDRLPQDSWRPRAEWVHRLGWARAQQGNFETPRTLTPMYLRLPEAEEVWRKRFGSKRG